MTLPGCCRGPYAAGDQHGQCAHVAPHARPAVDGIRPCRDRDREAEDECQPEIRAEGRGARLLPFTLSTLGIPAMAQLILSRLRGETVVLAFDLTQLDFPVDLAQRSLLPFGDGFVLENDVLGRCLATCNGQGPIVLARGNALLDRGASPRPIS